MAVFASILYEWDKPEFDFCLPPGRIREDPAWVARSSKIAALWDFCPGFGFCGKYRQLGGYIGYT